MAASKPVSMSTAEDLLRRVLTALISPPWVSKVNNSLQVTLSGVNNVGVSSGTISTVTTVSTVANQQQIGGFAVSGMHNNQVAWAECVRRVIT